jgi:hypothetical protein
LELQGQVEELRDKQELLALQALRVMLELQEPVFRV